MTEEHDGTERLRKRFHQKATTVSSNQTSKSSLSNDLLGEVSIIIHKPLKMDLCLLIDGNLLLRILYADCANLLQFNCLNLF